jgi:hypothetical protein
MIADILKLSAQQGRSYRLDHPESTLDEAQNEASRRWPEEARIGLCRAFFLSGWAQAAFERPVGECRESAAAAGPDQSRGSFTA